MKPYLDFYKKFSVSPVLNEIDISFFQKRKALYYKLGIIPSFLKGKTILEFGPGNGIHSLYTYSLAPSKYVLVDANPTAIKNCKKNFADLYGETPNLQIVDSLIEEYHDEQQSDLVICEGVIPHQKNPKEFCLNLSKFVKPGGLFMFTCHDYISTLSEVIRAFLGFLILDRTQSFNDQVEQLVDFYSDHFSSLKSMNRKPHDWVVDNIMYTDYWKESHWFSVTDALEILNDELMFYRCSPDFNFNWRKGSFSRSSINNSIKEQYLSNVHNLLDYRCHFKPRDKAENLELFAIAQKLREDISSYVDNPTNEILGQVIASLEVLYKNINTFSSITAASIKEVINFLKCDAKNSIMNSFCHLKNWWGRGNQVLTFFKE